MTNACPKCGLDRNMVGYSHRCVPVEKIIAALPEGRQRKIANRANVLVAETFDRKAYQREYMRDYMRARRAKSA
jgi:hypothetical protein